MKAKQTQDKLIKILRPKQHDKDKKRIFYVIIEMSIREIWSKVRPKSNRFKSDY